MSWKNTRFAFFFALLSLLPLANMQAICWNPFVGPHYICAGPEFEYIRRTRCTGSKMDGNLYGGWITYDRIHPCSLYYGFEGHWVTGKISGETNLFRTKANKRDSDIEGRIGFTFQSKSWRCWTFIPYVGYGYFNGITQFRPVGSNQTGVDPIEEMVNIRFRNTFQHYSAGFLSGFWLNNCFAVGLNLKWRYMNDGRQKIKNDPVHGTVKLLMQDKAHYSVELPLTYRVCICQRDLSASLVPFYRYRHYGSKENFPFDFFETKYRMYGGRLTLNFKF